MPHEFSAHPAPNVQPWCNLWAGEWYTISHLADRYTSAELLYKAIIAGDTSQETMQSIALACRDDDGADYASIPGLGGRPLEWFHYLLGD